MEFVSGYRDAMVDFSELLFSWYKKYLSDCASQINRRMPSKQREGVIRELPQDTQCWTFQVLQNRNISFQLRNPELQIVSGFYSDDSLRLKDLDKYISLVDLDGEGNDEVNGGGADYLYRIDYLLLVLDETGIVLGVDFLMGTNQGKQNDLYVWRVRAYNLLYQCMMRPMAGGGPRRPISLAVGDPSLHVYFEKLLPTLGIHLQKKHLRGWSLTENFTLSSKAVRSCHVCKKRSFETTLSPCGRCGAVLYCSETCKSRDWNKSPVNMSHESWCGKMAQYMEFEKKLADLPFHFIKEVTSPSFDKERFLSTHRITEGYWLAESIHYHSQRLLLKRPAWDLDGGREGNEPLPADVEAILQKFPAAGWKNPLVTWQEYYNWRGLPLDNPIAALLTYPLTLFHVITNVVPQNFPELNILKKQSLKIHIIEGRREYESILLFWELTILMPNVSFELVFVGDVLPLEEDKRHFILRRMGSKVICTDLTSPNQHKGEKGIHVKVHSHSYHSLQASKPDLVIGFNPGFGLNDTWLSTLPRLQSLKVPAYFSECSQYSCDVDSQVVAIATGGTSSTPVLNPFRSPLRIPTTDNCMPWYNNAFLFYLIYKSGANNSKQQHQPSQPQEMPEPAPEPAFEPNMRRKKKQGGRNNKKYR
ncbi:zinc finger MYND domain-containing protein 15 [Pelobates fuscus]|uniref:zinc finger MYND domain-containing protein 15 n=1 Tax=Pelobates fuscus TaxID=191477 RepID=UPI002FE4E2E0